MAEQVNMHEAKTQLSRLAERASQGEEIVIARNGKPLAKLGPVTEEPKGVIFGLAKGQIWVSEDFDEEDPEINRMFYGEED